MEFLVLIKIISGDKVGLKENFKIVYSSTYRTLNDMKQLEQILFDSF